MRIDQITFTRFLAAMAIVVFHYGNNIFPFDSDSVSFLFTQAYIGVSYFFILSGFVMIIAYGNKPNINTLEYYKNRFARIYPIYFLAILLVLFHRHISLSYTKIYDVILNILAVQAWVPGKALSINTPGWSLSVEFLFYAIFPFLFNFIYNNRNRVKKSIIPIVLIFFISQFLLQWFVRSNYYEGFPSKSHDLIHYFPLMHLNEFLMGNLAGLLYINKLKEKKRNYDILILVVLALIVLAFKYPMGLNYHDGLMAVLFIPLILLISLNNGIITSILKIKFFVFLGEISFGIYILQLPIFLWCSYMFSYLAIVDKTIIFYSSVLILIGISSISYILIETPLRNMIKKIKSKQTTTLKTT